MALQDNHSEGQTDGVAVTVGNSDDFGDTPYGVVSVTSMAAAYSTDRAAHGTRSVKFTGGTTAGSTAILGFSGYSATQAVSRVYGYFTALPTSSDCGILQFRTTAGPVAAVFLKRDGRINYQGPDGTNYISANPITLNTWTRIDAMYTVDPTNGDYNADVYTADSTTSNTGALGPTGVANTGTAAIVAVRAGKLTGAALLDTFYLDDFAGLDNTTTYLGPYVPINQPPVVTAGNDATITLGQTATLTGTATDPDGTIASRVWTCSSTPSGVTAPTISNATSNTATVTPTTAGTYTFTFTATDNQSKPASASVTIRVASGSGPTPAATVRSDLVVVDARASTAGSGGALTYTISPSSGTSQPVNGLFLVPRGSSAVTYTVTVVEAGSTPTPMVAVTVQPTTQAAPFTGAALSFALPVPGDPTTQGAWAAPVNAAITGLQTRLNDLRAYYSGTGS